MKVFVPKERAPSETRVAATPETVKKLVGEGLDVVVESSAGEASSFVDSAYEDAGATVTTDADAGWSQADAVLTVRGPDAEAAGRLKRGAVLIGFLDPDRNAAVVERLRDGGVTVLAMELVPRITRAQSMDALSSQASIGGYKAALVAAARLGKYFPLLMTAAGTVKPARVVVMGAGVAGLQALATCRRLGAVVEVSDIRPVVKEQVESLGGQFIDLPLDESGEGEGGYAKQMGEDFLRRQREIVTERVAQAHVVITTALVPGRPAPTLVTREMVERMQPGSVIVDLAIERGGNCELSEADREVMHRGVAILAPSNLPATVPADASTLYARNVLHLVDLLVEEGALAIDLDDEVVAGTLLTHGGEVVHEPTAERLAAQPQGASS